MITKAGFKKGKNYLFCYINEQNEEVREVEFFDSFSELEEYKNNLNGKMMEVLSLEYAFDHGIGFPDDQFYNVELDTFCTD